MFDSMVFLYGYCTQMEIMDSLIEKSQCEASGFLFRFDLNLSRAS
nr:MAG TPA: hypothetical protein [Caudoviricetes sp.]